MEKNVGGGVTGVEGDISARVVRSLGVPWWKRFLDVGVLLLSTPLLVPLMGLVALVIKIVSPGPLLFRQERVGYRGRRFVCVKFRTMRPGADDSLHHTHLRCLMTSEVPMLKLDGQGDPRLIPLGPLLRATGLDELPQVFSVLRGEMSLVGPRPCLPYEFEEYCAAHKDRLGWWLEHAPGLPAEWQFSGQVAVSCPACLPYQVDGYCYNERVAALPGLTGLWQVKGKNRTTFAQMMELDIFYVRNMSFWLDAKIILKTVPALLCQLLEMRRRGRRQPQYQAGTFPATRLDRAQSGGDS